MFDVLTIGTATRDTFLESRFFKFLKDNQHLKKSGFPTGEAQCLPLGAKLEVQKPILTVGGGAANAAVTFARQGLKTAAFFKVGADRPGEGIVQDLKKEKITVLATEDRLHGTGCSTILLAPSGERTILVYRGASEYLKLNEVPLSRLSAKWVYIVPGDINVLALSRVINFLHKNKVAMAMNPSKFYLNLGAKKLKPILEKLSVVSLNREEAAYLTGIDYKNEKAIFKKLDELIGGIAIMTDGPRGVMVSDGRNIYSAGTFRERKVVDRTGSGDAFGSGFVAGLMKYQKSNPRSQKFAEEGIKYAIRLGSANATSVVEHIGAEAGTLSKRDFNNSRWRNLKVEIKQI